MQFSRWGNGHPTLEILVLWSFRTASPEADVNVIKNLARIQGLFCFGICDILPFFGLQYVFNMIESLGNVALTIKV